MKLRTTNNSIRIRIRKSELEILRQKHKVEESIRFPNGVMFQFALVIDKTINSLTANLADNNLVLLIPRAEAITWITTNQVGINSKIPLPNDEALQLLIEKDFPCIDRENEDKSDTFQELVPEKPKVC